MLFENLGKKEESNRLDELKGLIEVLKRIDAESEKSKEERTKKELSDDEAQSIKVVTLATLNILLEQQKMLQQGIKFIDSDMTFFKMKFMHMMIVGKPYAGALAEFASCCIEEIFEHREKFGDEFVGKILELLSEFCSRLNMSTKEE